MHRGTPPGPQGQSSIHLHSSAVCGSPTLTVWIRGTHWTLDGLSAHRGSGLSQLSPPGGIRDETQDSPAGTRVFQQRPPSWFPRAAGTKAYSWLAHTTAIYSSSGGWRRSQLASSEGSPWLPMASVTLCLHTSSTPPVSSSLLTLGTNSHNLILA